MSETRARTVHRGNTAAAGGSPMPETRARTVRRGNAAAAGGGSPDAVGLLAFVLAALALAAPDAGAQDTDWPVYLGDAGRSHYSALDQIDRGNVHELEVAWTYDSGELRGSRSTMYTSPLVIDGVLYGLSPRLVAFALDAATGDELWRHDPGLPGAAQRGLMWWDGDGGPRLFYTAGRILIALDPATGEPAEAFGDGGRLDLMLPGESGPMTVTAPGVVFEDRLVFGFSTSESDGALPGSIRAFDAGTGELEWQFHSIPRPDDPGAETWAPGSLENAGGANTWTAMALDEERGLLFVPTGSATPDFYGGRRPGDNLYANCLLALDARTGELRWHFQVVRHDIWDRDLPAPPTLVELERDGTVIDAVALTTKSGHLYVFDRDTGEPLYDIIEEETLPSELPGEVPAPTEPVSAVAVTRQAFELTTRSPEAAAHVQEIIRDFDLRPWAPPTLDGTLFFPGYDGGAEWGGSAFDPGTDRLIVNMSEIGGILQLYEIPVGFSDGGVYAEHCGSCHGPDLEGTENGPGLDGVIDRLGRTEVETILREGRGRMPPFGHLGEIERRGVLRHLAAPAAARAADTPSTEVRYAHGGYRWVRDHDGLPGNTPPWGTLTSVDLATGEFDWQVPFGGYPGHEDLGYGSESYGGPVVTAGGLVFIAATPDRKLRAVDVRNGEELWQAELPAAGYSTPVTYTAGGRQFVVIAAGGGRQGPPSGSEYWAFSLPEE